MDLQQVNDLAIVYGEVVFEPLFSHVSFGEKFYRTEVAVERLSRVTDMVPVIVSEKLINQEKKYAGKEMAVKGKFRSLNIDQEDRRRLMLYLFADTFEESEQEKDEDNNYVFLHGTICKGPVFRTTPLGREIADIFVTINRPSGKSDYIPCICWGRNARYTSRVLKMGDKISIEGRIQSREYKKKMPDGSLIDRTAYEVSVRRIELTESEQKAI